MKQKCKKCGHMWYRRTPKRPEKCPSCHCSEWWEHRKSLESRFWAKVEKTETCWLWKAGKARTGYGMISIGRKMETAHRVSWQLHNGIVPNGLHVLHKCDVRECVNPDHLFLGTNADNIRDMWAKQRGTRTNAKLTVEQVLAIRNDNRTRKAIASDYGVSSGTITAIKLRINWKQV